ncbi:hypothetical protein ACFFJ7_19210 [Pseudochelatococcus lubricantis]|uniref:hypothetical protein n=1 Tax=Pseudochelatococcus lubricantis TaxID=1538102 RepID=UPI0035ECCC73
MDHTTVRIETAWYEPLPDIDIAVREQPQAVIVAMANLAEADSSLVVERHAEPLGEMGWYIVNLRSLGPSIHEEAGGQLIARPDCPGRILVEMRALRWQPDPPSRDAYVAAARELMVPLLSAYNKASGQRYRIRIERVRKPGNLPSKRTRILLDRFAVLANQKSLHPLDWERFYRFVKESRRPIPMEAVRALLIEHGFPADRASGFAELYEHLWAFKRLR